MAKKASGGPADLLWKSLASAPKTVVSALGKLVDMATTTGKWGLGAAVVAPPVLGGLAGYSMARARSDDYDPDEAVQNEELAGYYRAIQRLQRAEKRQKQLLRA
jgi:hypothetical protein